MVAFTLTDAEGDPVDVRLCLHQPGGALVDLQLVDGEFAGEILDTSLEGLEANHGEDNVQLFLNGR